MAQMQFRSDDTEWWPYKFGDGSDGSTYATPTNRGAGGSAGSTTVSTDASGFVNGDLVLIHQSRGTGAGNWELNKIASGGGTTSLTMKHSLKNTYTNSGNSQAQILELKQYTTFSTGSITVPAWDGNKGGIVAFLCNGTCTVNGTINADSKGYKGGQAVTSGNGYAGEGSSGTSTSKQTANGSGGGGGLAGGSGGGGGNGASGSQGLVVNTQQGAGGSSAGNSGLTSMVFGGGGGSGAGFSSSQGAGGAGGGLVYIFSKQLTITGTITLDGANGTSGQNRGSGGGAGGSCLLKAQTATLGTTKIAATAGSGGVAVLDSSYRGGAGSVGRIHLDYMNSYTGSTSPTLNASQDYSLRLGVSTATVI